MKIVAPLRVQAVAAVFFGMEKSCVVQVALRDYVNLPAEAFGGGANLLLKLREEMVSAEVEDSVNRIKPKRIDVEVLDPIERVIDEEAADGVALRSVKVYCFSPWRLVTRSEIGPKEAQVVSFWAEVVVDHVERDR